MLVRSRKTEVLTLEPGQLTFWLIGKCRVHTEEKSWNNFPDPEKVWKKNGKKSWVFFFFKAMASALEVKHCFGQIVFILLHVFAAHHAKTFVWLHFYVSIYHLFDNLETGKRNNCIGEKSGKSLTFWIQTSVRTLKWYGFYLLREQYEVL